MKSTMILEQQQQTNQLVSTPMQIILVFEYFPITSEQDDITVCYSWVLAEQGHNATMTVLELVTVLAASRILTSVGALPVEDQSAGRVIAWPKTSMRRQRRMPKIAVVAMKVWLRTWIVLEEISLPVEMAAQQSGLRAGAVLGIVRKDVLKLKRD